MIYFITDETNKSCKIGYSANPETRLSSLQTGTINPLKLVSVLPGDRNKEKELHNTFKKFHIKGEWFKITPEIEKILKDTTNTVDFLVKKSRTRIFIDYDITEKVFTVLYKRYAHSREFGLPKQFKEILCKEIKCNLYSFNVALDKLVEDKRIFNENKLYKF